MLLGGEGIVWESGMDIHTPLDFKWITNKDLLYSTGNSTQCYVVAWKGAGFGGKWIHVYVGLSPLALHLKLHNIVNCYTPIQNKKFKKRESPRGIKEYGREVRVVAPQAA